MYVTSYLCMFMSHHNVKPQCVCCLATQHMVFNSGKIYFYVNVSGNIPKLLLANIHYVVSVPEYRCWQLSMTLFGMRHKSVVNIYSASEKFLNKSVFLLRRIITSDTKSFCKCTQPHWKCNVYVVIGLLICSFLLLVTITFILLFLYNSKLLILLNKEIK